MQTIPCLDLKRQHQAIKQEVFELFDEVYANTAFSGGPFVERFEKLFSDYTGVTHVVGVNNGTSALHLAMLVLGIGAGDEVILPANTFIATAWGPSYVGATPVFVDCDPHHWQIDPAAIEKAITPKTKAIIGVHLYGMPCDVDAIAAIAKKHNIYFIEDAAQAQGSRYKGTMVGGFGAVSCYSYYPGKNLGACGEAGGLATRNEAFYKHLLSLRNHGGTVRYYHDEVGFNMRMGGLEAASLQVKMRYLEQWNNRRRAIAKRYLTEIKNPKIKMQAQPEWADSNYHLFVVTAEDKEALVQHLIQNGIQPGFHYPVPCHLQKAYTHLGYTVGSMPHAEYLASHAVSFPMFAELTEEEVQRVIDAANAF